MASSIPVRAAEVNVLFSEAYDAAPPLPRPLKTKQQLQYITAKGMRLEALSVAPISAEEEAKCQALGLDQIRSHTEDDDITRITKRLNIYLKKSAEFAIVHDEMARAYESTVSIIGLVATAVSAVVTYTVTYDQYTFNGVVPGLATVLAGMLRAWVMYAKYDTLKEQHATAAQAFNMVTQTISDILAECNDEPEPDENAPPAAAGAGASSDSSSGGAAEAKVAGDVEQPTADEKAADEAFVTNCPEDVKPGREVILKYKVAAQLAYKRLEDAQTGALSKEAKAEAKKKSAEAKSQAEAAKAASKAASKAGKQQVEAEPADPDDSQDADASAVVLRLRALYRKAVEYRIAHSIYETRYRRGRVGLSFTHLFLSTLTSAVLFLDVPLQWSVALSALLTGLNSAMQALDLAGKEEQHAMARLVFAGLQRSIATVLMLHDNASVANVFQGLALQFQEAERSAVKILGLDFIKNPETKQKMFHLIGDQAFLKSGTAFHARARGAAAKARSAESEAKAKAAYADHRAKKANAPHAPSPKQNLNGDVKGSKGTSLDAVVPI